MNQKSSRNCFAIENIYHDSLDNGTFYRSFGCRQTISNSKALFNCQLKTYLIYRN